MFVRTSVARVSSISAALMLASLAGAQTNFTEVEPNDNKAGSNLVAMVCGDTITGNSTGVSTTAAGPASADTYRIRTVSNGSIMLYTLTMSQASGTLPPHTLTTRGLDQAAGVPGTIDTTLSTAQTVGTTKVLRWYGTGAAGAQQDIYVRVAGTASSTENYVLTLSCQAVTPTPVGGTFQVGNVTVKPDAATATAIDTDWTAFDATHTAIAGFSHDDADETGAVRNLSAGTYYVAMGNYNTATNLGSPTDDTFRTAALMDFPNVLVNTTTGSLTTMNTTVTDGVNTNTGFGGRSDSFMVAWYSFVVAPPTIPTGSGAATPATVAITGNTLLTVNVTPAVSPTSTGITVVGNLSSINGSSSQAFFDNGTNGDAVAGDNVFSFLATVAEPASAGAVTVPFTVADAQGRNSSSNIGLTLTAAPTGSCCTAGNCSIATAYNCINGGGTYNGNGSTCDGSVNTIGTSTDAFPMVIPQPATSGVTPGSVSATLTLPPGSGTANNLAVVVGLNHTWMGDVRLKISNGVNSVDLVYRTNVINQTGETGWQSNYDGTYVFSDTAVGDLWTTGSTDTAFVIPSGHYHPSSMGSGALSSPSLSVFNGSPLEGTWTLTAEDWWTLDGGNLTSFALATVTPVNCNQATCGTSDYNGDGDFGTDSDIEAFFACLAGNCCPTCFVGGSDFNADGDFGTDADIESFFRVLAGGPC